MKKYVKRETTASTNRIISKDSLVGQELKRRAPDPSTYRLRSKSQKMKKYAKRETTASTNPIISKDSLAGQESKRGSSGSKDSVMKSHKRMDTKGGIIRLEAFNISLNIPPGAIGEEEGSVVISIGVLMHPTSLRIKDEEMIASFGFECAPRGLTFKRPVCVTLPHCAESHNPSDVDVRLYFLKGNKKEWARQKEDTLHPFSSMEKDRRCKLDADVIYIYLDHFCKYWPAVKSQLPRVNRKRLACLPFLARTMCPDWKVVLRVYLYHSVKGSVVMRKEIIDDEATMEGRVPHSGILFLFSLNQKNLLIQCEGDENIRELQTEELDYDDIRTLPKNNVDFELDFSDRRCNNDITAKIRVFVKQCSKEKKMIISHTFAVTNDQSTPLDDSASNQASCSNRNQALTISMSGYSDEKLSRLAESLGDHLDVRKVARALGFTRQESNNYSKTNRIDGWVTNKGTEDMLFEWKKRTPKQNQIPLMKKALENGEFGELIEQYCQLR